MLLPTCIPAIRDLAPGDSMKLLTELVHAAYAPHAARGLRYWGTHQTVDDTATRFRSGHGLVAEFNGTYVGTITVRPPQPQSPIALYRDRHTWTVSQFAVAPSFKDRHLGKALHQAAIAHVLRHGGKSMALDTAAPAVALIAMYLSWGYRVVGRHDWQPHTNYVSIVMSLPLAVT